MSPFPPGMAQAINRVGKQMDRDLIREEELMTRELHRSFPTEGVRSATLGEARDRLHAAYDRLATTLKEAEGLLYALSGKPYAEPPASQSTSPGQEGFIPNLHADIDQIERVSSRLGDIVSVLSRL